jgi:hypothetical protein
MSNSSHNTENTSLKADLIWGIDAIAAEIARNRRQTFYLLENGKLPAKKLMGRWCSTRTGLRQFFQTMTAVEVA